METKDIRTALERLLVMAERSQQHDWPSAIERDLMLAELRKIYETLLFAPADAARTDVVTTARADAEAVPDGMAVAMVPAVDMESLDEQADIEPLDLEGDFDDAPVAEPLFEAEPVEVVESVAQPSTSVPVQQPDEAEVPTEPEPAEPEPTDAVPADSGTEVVEDARRRSLLFDLGAIQHRTHRRMMSLYDDDTFDRLPDTPAAAQPAAVSEDATEDVQPAAVAEEVAVGTVVEVAEATADDAAAEASEETESADNADAAEESEEVVWSEPEQEPEQEYIPQYEPETSRRTEPESVSVSGPEPESEPESEPKPVSAPVSARTIGDIYAGQQESQAAAPAVLGDVMNSNVEVLGDTLAAQASLGDTLAHAPVTGGLKSALDISDRYQIIAELFGGDAGACDDAMEQLDAMESLEDAVIYIEENFRWNPSSPATALVMDLLDRKFS